jgi:hypothetical protein
MSLFATKPLTRLKAESDGGNQLRRTPGPRNLVTLRIGATLERGFFPSRA